MTRFVVVMPAYNEAEGMAEFLEEIVAAFAAGEVSVVVVDDASRDGTRAVVERLQAGGFPVQAFVNEVNLGHGPTTIRALTAGVESDAEVIVAVDGDGQFTGEGIAMVAQSLLVDHVDVVEGVRNGRSDPPYRTAVSAATRQLVKSATGVRPRDANTPLRAYRRERLSEVLLALPKDAMTPNLLISARTRRDNWVVREVDVASLQRRGASGVGTTWGPSLALLPSRRFLRFCWNALLQWRRIGRLS